MVRERKIFKNCPYCRASVRDINFDYHLAKVHSVVTKTQREERGILGKVAFLKDYVKRRNLEKMTKKADEKWYRPSIPSPGAMGRFMRRHHEEIYRFMREAYKKMGGMQVDLLQPVKPNKFVEKAERTGRFKETIVEVEEKKRDLGGSDPDRWAFENQFRIMNVWKLGFELYLTDLFFSKERWGNCRRPDKEEVQCEEGYSNCIFDEEFNQFEFDCVRKIVDQLRNGIEPEELEIPEHLRCIEAKMRELSGRTTKGWKQER